MNDPLWACPVCGCNLLVRAHVNANGLNRGFRFDCYGQDENPHRIVVYLNYIGEKTVVPTLAPTDSGEPVRHGEGARASALLARVSELGRKRQNNGRG